MSEKLYKIEYVRSDRNIGIAHVVASGVEEAIDKINKKKNYRDGEWYAELAEITKVELLQSDDIIIK